MLLYPRIVIPHNVLMVQAGQQRHLPFNPSKLLAGGVDENTLHCIAAAIQFVLDLPRGIKSKCRRAAVSNIMGRTSFWTRKLRNELPHFC